MQRWSNVQVFSLLVKYTYFERSCKNLQIFKVYNVKILHILTRFFNECLIYPGREQIRSLQGSCKIMYFLWVPWNNLARWLLKMDSFLDPCEQCIACKDLARILYGLHFFHELGYTAIMHLAFCENPLFSEVCLSRKNPQSSFFQKSTLVFC